MFPCLVAVLQLVWRAQYKLLRLVFNETLTVADLATWGRRGAKSLEATSRISTLVVNMPQLFLPNLAAVRLIV